MKLRLSITTASGASKSFEHAGPIIRIGRDPGCELSLQGALGDAVSRQHACIDLMPKGAMLTDVGSSNGTLLNDCLLDGAARLSVGDRIQMGHTGATLKVVELDLASRTAVTAPRVSRPVLIGTVAAGALAVVVIVLVLVLNPWAPKVPAPNFVEGSETPPSQQPEPKLNDRPNPPPPPPPPSPPNEEVKEVGSYVALDQWVSVLLQRQGEAFPWTVLRPEARVSTACTLVSLPGYRSLIALDSGPHLTLWGNLPEFSASPPVLESVVMLHNPSPGIDLDFTLDRGRVLIVNRKKAEGPVHVRLRFLREAWELELPDAKSEVVVELWTLPHGATPQQPVTCLGLFAKGEVRVNKTPRQSFTVNERSPRSWVSQQPTEVHRVDLTELPAWWTKPPDRTAPEVQKALLSLLDWSERLGGSNVTATSLVSTIKTQVQNVEDPDNQDVGVFFLAALDEMEPLVDFLNDRKNANVRGVTLFALQSWLSRGGQHAAELVRILERRGSSKDQAEHIVRLLHFYPPEALEQRKTYEDLIGCLDDEILLVRDLAYWHLDQLGVGGRLPEEARNIPYDPTWPPEKRRPAVEQWKKLLSEGKIPLHPSR